MLRTYRRAEGEKRNAEVNVNMGFLQKIMHHVNSATSPSKTITFEVPMPRQAADGLYRVGGWAISHQAFASSL